MLREKWSFSKQSLPWESENGTLGRQPGWETSISLARFQRSHIKMQEMYKEPIIPLALDELQIYIKIKGKRKRILYTLFC